ncbi:putative non-specific serine/threonine protein kinase [Helianthus annuus]|nr:putative non-specific serine/threonine protein kinase [Helianthus annuus]
MKLRLRLFKGSLCCQMTPLCICVGWIKSMTGLCILWSTNRELWWLWTCGPYGSCSPIGTPPCTCIAGFKPRVPDEWIEELGLVDVNVTGFRLWKWVWLKRISGVIFPDTRRSWYNQSMTLEECEMACSLNCNCTAFAHSDIRNGGIGCLLWFDELIDTTESDDKQGLYIKLAASELAAGTHLWF